MLRQQRFSSCRNLDYFHSTLLNVFKIASCLLSNRTLLNTPKYPLAHPRPTLTPSPLHAGNRIGDAGAAAVAGALEPRRNGDGSWTPSTALTELYLSGEWALILMVVAEEE
jgi:hypothetical protein